jgi:hypothetical protein
VGRVLDFNLTLAILPLRGNHHDRETGERSMRHIIKRPDRRTSRIQSARAGGLTAAVQIDTFYPSCCRTMDNMLFVRYMGKQRG